MRPKLPTEVQILSVALGSRGSSSAGTYVNADAKVTARIEGDSSGLFQVVRIETDDVVSDPDSPHGHPPLLVLEPAIVVQGAGPIDVFQGEAIQVFVEFACPSDPPQAVFHANVVLEGPGLPASISFPIIATARIGLLQTEALLTPAVLPGQTANFVFRVHSSMGHDLAVAFQYDSVFQPLFSAPTQILEVPAGGSADVTVPLTCAIGTLAGGYSVIFQLRAPDGSRIFGQVEIGVTVTRIVTVVPSLPSDIQLQQGDSVLCMVRVTITGGPAKFSIAPGPLPAGVSLTGGQTIAVNEAGFVGLNIQVSPSAPLGKLAPLTLFWTVDESTIKGQFSLNIETVQGGQPQLPAELHFDLDSIAFETGVAAGGFFHLTLREDGTYSYSGHFHDSGAVDYNTNLAIAIKDSKNMVYTFPHSGHVFGTFSPGSRDDDWNINDRNEAIARNWNDIVAASAGTYQASVKADITNLTLFLIGTLGLVAGVIQIVQAAVKAAPQAKTSRRLGHAV